MLLLSAPFYAPSPVFYTGVSSSSSLVPDTFHVALDGRPYMVDLNQPFYRQYRRQLAQLIRTQADTSSEPGDQSMDPNSLWRRSYEDWTLGAGQRYLDRPAVSGSSTSTGSVPNAFWQSKGIDALSTKWQISLLPETRQVKATTNSNLAVVVVGTHIYVIDGQHLYFASSVGGSWTTVTGTPAVTASSVCTDGFNVWVAYGASGVYTTTEGAAAATQYVTSAVDSAAVLGYCNGRLMLASTNVLYNIIGSGALPSPLLTAGNPNMVFVGFAEGTNAIYAAAHAGNRSWIYGMTVTSDGVALGAPVIQGALPSGETITSILGYLSFLVVGSSLGVRMCSTTASGGVVLGALIATPASVQCLSGWSRFVYFGYSTYDSTSTGLGRLDLQNQVISGVLPAYCSDLMVTSQDPVTSLAVYAGDALFAVSGLGLYAPDHTQLVSAGGSIDSGYILYDLTDSKVACLLDVQQVGPNVLGTFSGWVSVDGGPFDPVGSIVDGGQSHSHTFGVGPVTGQRFEVRITIDRSAGNTNLAPTVTRWTLRSYPAPKRPITWQLPLILNEEVVNKSSGSSGFDPQKELQALEAMATNGQMVTFQEGRASYPVFVQDVEFLPDYTMEDRRNAYFNGIALVTLVGLPATV